MPAFSVTAWQMRRMKDSFDTDSILYAPGRGNDMSVLSDFREELFRSGKSLRTIPFLYDKGSFNPRKLLSLVPSHYPWWIGISLGASLLWMLASYSDCACRPQRLTLINPFADRARLSSERGFSLEGQWNFAPINHKLCLQHIDIVLSVHDEAISAAHGLELLMAVKACVKELIIIDGDHRITNTATQRELARLLIREKVNRNDDNQHCHIYQWRRDIQ